MRLVALSVCLIAAAFAQPLPVSTPAQEGLSPERLARLHGHFDRLTASRERPGALTLILRNGKIADFRAYGLRDVEANLPMQRDTLFRIYSMTKPITSVAVMMLVEEGKLTLDDPVSKFIPEFKSLQVWQSGTPDRPITVAPVRAMTVRHLLTHTSGLIYGWGNDNVSELYRRTKIFEVSSLQEFVAKLAKLPLASHPGERYEYSASIDVLGYLVQVVSGQPFDAFVQQRILDPLEMKDTHFFLPAAKRARLAKTYSLRDGKLSTPPEVSDLKVPFGGMGLFSTIDDYARFAQMLLNGGRLHNTRLLSRKTVELMTMNHLAHLAVPHNGGDQSDGFGLGGAVRIDPARSGRPASAGLFGWNGAASTYFRIDPKEKMAALCFLQWMPFDGATLNLFETLAWQSIAD